MAGDNIISVVVCHANRTEEEIEHESSFETEYKYLCTLPRKQVRESDLLQFLEQCSRKTERSGDNRERVDLIVSFDYWPEFLLVTVYDWYVE